MEIYRRSRTMLSLSITTSLTTTPEIDLRDMAGGVLHVENGSAAVTFTYQSAAEPGGTYEPLYDKNGAAVVQTVAADQAHPLHEAAFGSGAIKLVGDDTATVNVSLKG